MAYSSIAVRAKNAANLSCLVVMVKVCRLVHRLLTDRAPIFLTGQKFSELLIGNSVCIETMPRAFVVRIVDTELTIASRVLRLLSLIVLLERFPQAVFAPRLHAHSTMNILVEG